MADPHRLREELRRMRQLIEDDPRVKAQFDLDGNGVIDGDEWERVRQLVIARIDREEAELAAGACAAREAGLSDDDIPVVQGSIAAGVFEDDLPVLTGTAVASTAVRDQHELILVQEGTLSQLFEGFMRRAYTIRSIDGTEIGAIEQVENEMFQQWGNRSLFSRPDLHFSAFCASGQRVTFRRSREFAKDTMAVLDEQGIMRAIISWQFSLIARQYKIVSTIGGLELKIRSPIYRPYTYFILDVVDDEVGRVERGWSGLASIFVGGANKMRIKIDQQVDEWMIWGLLGASLLADLGSEDSSSKMSVLDTVTDLLD